ncbi:hypothetical protein SARC_06212 [Sphaeroforma arctica JP610]|uniref:RGS domain-containing protein n=1 Tax=Sphaeroforma arctica JP610 TaxID=667725 RepID=A0A0L0FY25_9EUKA|nr:hypothetical protein SARC_06212 [Sphaeroforma arctica JP610]KNC81466.1 hypothetical protein SARC_06212 [Sphaeroforma arctica JP610]|eukprot:XP_014155368.1 hypothetical protein SARC_06212 [Sphaeroforma arctica JP610]
MFFGMYMFQLIYDIISPRLDVISVLCFIFMTPATLLVAWLEILGPALVKITGRKLQLSLLGGSDLCGIATEFGTRGFDNVLSDPFLLEKFTESCTKQYCTENVMFLKSMLDVRIALNSGTNPAGSRLGVYNATAAAMVHAVIERHITEPEPCMEINISSHTKEAILKQMSFLRSDLISDTLSRSLNDAEERVCCARTISTETHNASSRSVFDAGRSTHCVVSGV